MTTTTTIVRTARALSSTSSESPPKSKSILVVGSSGALGSEVSRHFSQTLKHDVIGADVVPSDGDLNGFVRLPDGGLSEQAVALHRGVSDYFSAAPGSKLDGVVCASGGWEGDAGLAGALAEEDFVKTSAEAMERMMCMNFFPVVASSLASCRFMRKNGLFVVIGASTALSPTPGMIAYGTSKAAAHHYLQTWGSAPSQQLHGLPKATSVAILPLTLDTPANRAIIRLQHNVQDDAADDKAIIKANRDFDSLVRPIDIAHEIGEWIQNPHLRPHSGSLVKVISNRKDGLGSSAFHLVR